MVSSDSRTSSMLSMNTTSEMEAQQARQQHACSCLMNCVDMCFNHHMVDQSKLYEEHMQAQYSVVVTQPSNKSHDMSITEEHVMDKDNP